jgi:hypothetical protein
MPRLIPSASGLLFAATLLFATVASGGGKAATKGTVSSYEADQKTVILVETCAPQGDSWDYVPCLRDLREKTVNALCKRGSGSYKWGFMVGDEKPLLMQSTNCK